MTSPRPVTDCPPRRHRGRKTAAAAIIASVTALAWFLTEPLAQNPGYHEFADQRSLLGVPHALNVLSNVAFCITGLWGCRLLAAGRRTRPFQHLLQGAFFVALLCTGLGSAYYHLWPGHTTLIWDRLPMTAAFMAFTCLVLAERCSESLARKLFPWLLMAGPLSVLYWGWVDDLRPYALIQFGPMLILPVVIWRYDGPGTRWLWLTLAWYFIAKLLEVGDYQVLILTDSLVSGHTLKHLAAAVGAAMIVVKVSRAAVPTADSPNSSQAAGEGEPAPHAALGTSR